MCLCVCVLHKWSKGLIQVAVRWRDVEEHERFGIASQWVLHELCQLVVAVGNVSLFQSQSWDNITQSAQRFINRICLLQNTHKILGKLLSLKYLTVDLQFKNQLKDTALSRGLCNQWIAYKLICCIHEFGSCIGNETIPFLWALLDIQLLNLSIQTEHSTCECYHFGTYLNSLPCRRFCCYINTRQNVRTTQMTVPLAVRHVGRSNQLQIQPQQDMYSIVSLVLRQKVSIHVNWIKQYRYKELEERHWQDHRLEIWISQLSENTVCVGPHYGVLC